MNAGICQAVRNPLQIAEYDKIGTKHPHAGGLFTELLTLDDGIPEID
jgi:hypothetical protein